MAGSSAACAVPTSSMAVSFAAWTTPELQRALDVLDGELGKAAPLTAADYEDKYWNLRTQLQRTVTLYAQRFSAGTWSAWQFRDAMTKTLRKAYTEAYRYGAFQAEGRRSVLSE